MTTLSDASSVPASYYPALLQLWQAHHVARDEQVSTWQCALTLAELRQAGLNGTDVRSLLLAGWIDSQLEATHEECGERCFRRTARSSLNERTCFVLTELGGTITTALLGDLPNRKGRPFSMEEALSVLQDGHVPRWDVKHRLLWVGPHVVREFTRSADKQEVLVRAFAAADWDQTIKNPFIGDVDATAARRLRKTVSNLNSSLLHKLLHFYVGNHCEEVHWELCSKAIC